MEKAAANAEEGARRRTPSFLTRHSLLICCSPSHAAAFNSPAIPPHPDKRRRPHEQRFHTCAHVRSPLRGSHLTAALALGKRRSARLPAAQTNRTKIPVRKIPHGYVFVLFYQVDEKSILSFASSAPLISENLWSSCSTVRFFFSSPFTSKII